MLICHADVAKCKNSLAQKSLNLHSVTAYYEGLMTCMMMRAINCHNSIFKDMQRLGGLAACLALSMTIR